MEVRNKVAGYASSVAEDDWLIVWLLGKSGELDAAAVMLVRLLERGWLPNHQEMLVPVEQDQVYLVSRSHTQGERIERLPRQNRQQVIRHIGLADQGPD